MKSNNNILSFLTINDLKNHKVYEITNNINSKKYVGFTKQTVEERFNGHCKSPYYIGNAIRKHGRENFTIKVLVENITKEEADKLEKYYIRELDTLAKNGKGYNIAEGGQGGNTFVGMSEEQKAAFSKTMSEAAIKREANKTLEQKAEQYKKQKETNDNKSPEQKALESLKKSEASTKIEANKTLEQKAEISKKQSESQKRTYANKSLEQRTEHRKNISESWKKRRLNTTLEQKAITSKKMSESRTTKFTKEESDFIFSIFDPKRKNRTETARSYNQKFNKNISEKAIRNFIYRMCLK